MSTEFKAVFNYEGDISKLSMLSKMTFEHFFVKMRGEVIDETNEKLEDWNNEFDRAYPGKNGMTNEYVKFLIDKFMPFVNKVNAKHGFSKGKDVWLDYEVIDAEDYYADFVMKMDIGHPVRCYITLRPI